MWKRGNDTQWFNIFSVIVGAQKDKSSILLGIFISNRNKRVFNECLDMCDHSNMITLLCFEICNVRVPFFVSVEERASTVRKHRW